MAKYTKTKSKYVKRSFHQNVNNGIITERDWYTLGSINNFGPGKTPAYSDGNFVFTSSNTKNAQKRNNLGQVSDVFAYDDVKNANVSSNTIKVLSNSNDIRDFAYYGSCVELLRASVENIIKEFPARVILSNRQLEVPPITADGDFKAVSGYIISNPFDIDLFNSDVIETEVENPMRFLSLSWDKYELNGKAVTGFTSEWIASGKNCSQEYEWDVYLDNSGISKPVAKTTITSEGGSLVLKGYQVDGDIVYVSENDFILSPTQEVIDEYFSSLEGFEAQLLNTRTKPLYKNVFITPIEGELTYKYVNRDYVWPSNGYCIDIESPSYVTYIDKLYKMAQTFDEICCDNLYRNMTHEAIKNFDWTYTRDYQEGDEQDNVDGGERMKKIIHIIGRVFDDVKKNIDGIKANNSVTYSSFNNMPDALLSDKLTLQGWDVKSTIPTFDDVEENLGQIRLDDDILDNMGCKWFPSMATSDISSSDNDFDFVRRMILSSKRILSSKGTINSIHMVMAMFGFGNADENNPDYAIKQEYAWVDPTKYKYDEHADNIDYINKNKSFALRYDEPFSGLPLGNILIGSERYIIPFYDMNKSYDGNLYFQSKGGWGKTDEDFENGINYKETLSYLKIVSNVGDLMKINPFDAKDNDIYYVVDLSDYIDYYELSTEETQPINTEDLTHFFRLTDRYNIEKFSSWENVPSDDEQAIYLDSIITTMLGNNPHVGYGDYDCGKTYFDYMGQPFKYSIDNFRIEDNDLMEKAQDIKWDINKVEDGDKIVVFDGAETMSEKYYLNSKVLVFENKLDNKYYKEYFMNVILHYLMQVIPSTTILILKGF